MKITPPKLLLSNLPMSYSLLKGPTLSQNGYFANKKERLGILLGHYILVDEIVMFSQNAAF